MKLCWSCYLKESGRGVPKVNWVSSYDLPDNAQLVAWGSEVQHQTECRTRNRQKFQTAKRDCSAVQRFLTRGWIL